MHFQLSSVVLAALLGSAPSYAMLDCKKIVADGHTFNLDKLSGPHSVVTSKYSSSAETFHNTTYTLDVCKPLKKGGKDKSCPNGTRGKNFPDDWAGSGYLAMLTSAAVCAIERLINGDSDNISEIIAIAGSLEQHGGTAFDYEVTRLKTSDSKSDSDKEGLRLALKGGKHPLNGPAQEKKEQKAIIEFLCDPDKTGTEGEWESEDKYEKRADKDEIGRAHV